MSLFSTGTEKMIIPTRICWIFIFCNRNQTNIYLPSIKHNPFEFVLRFGLISSIFSHLMTKNSKYSICDFN